MGIKFMAIIILIGLIGCILDGSLIKMGGRKF